MSRQTADRQGADAIPKTTRLLRWITCLTVASLWLSACGTPPSQRDALRNDVDRRADAALARFLDAYPELSGRLSEVDGYAIAMVDSTMIGVVRGVGGRAVLVDNSTGSRTYLNVKKLGVGLGIGATEFDQLLLFEDRQDLESLKRGRWDIDSITWSGSGSGATARLPRGGTAQRFFITTKGSAITADTGVLRISLDKDLTDEGVAAVSRPTRALPEVGEQTEAAPRYWPYRMPFLGREVVKRGFDLPVPYGVGTSLVSVEQEISIDGLQVGFNGAEPVPYEWVGFENTKTPIRSAQFKADVWVLPFLNLFGLIGEARGEVTSDVLLDGNGLLDFLGSDCDRLIPPIECILFRDKNAVLPLRVDVDGIRTYGLGAVAAYGWKSYFVTVPVTVSYTEGKRSVTDGNSFTFTPRVGKVFNLRDKGNLALFLGGNRLDTNLTVDGLFEVPETDLVIDYVVDQSNVDKWNVVLGFNWDISRRLSWSFEYNGFTGSREAWITSLTLRPF